MATKKERPRVIRLKADRKVAKKLDRKVKRKPDRKVAKKDTSNVVIVPPRKKKTKRKSRSPLGRKPDSTIIRNRRIEA